MSSSKNLWVICMRPDKHHHCHHLIKSLLLLFKPCTGQPSAGCWTEEDRLPRERSRHHRQHRAQLIETSASTVNYFLMGFYVMLSYVHQAEATSFCLIIKQKVFFLQFFLPCLLCILWRRLGSFGELTYINTSV